MSIQNIEAPDVRGEGNAAARLVVDLAALGENYRAIAASTAAEAAGVVKANGYGLGAVAVARALHAAGCRTFFTAFTSEAVELRRAFADAEIFVLMPLVGEEAHVLLRHGLVPCLFDADGVERWIGRATADGAAARAALHVETGIHRLGLDAQELDALLADDVRRSRLRVAMLMSHLACADEPSAPANRRQIERFRAIRNTLPDARASFANSAATFLGPDYHFDLVRPGIALYGHDPTICTPRPGCVRWRRSKRESDRSRPWSPARASDTGARQHATSRAESQWCSRGTPTASPARSTGTDGSSRSWSADTGLRCSEPSRWT